MMSAPRCYLDYNATVPLRPAARAACTAALAITGNPSSVHHEGREARRLTEQARRSVAALVGAKPDGVIFTSGATEAANLLLTPELARDGTAGRLSRLLVTATEHTALLRGHRFPLDCVTVLPVDGDGLVRLDALAQALAADGGSPCLLALQAANNETGVLQPVRQAADLIHAAGGLVICDAVQIAGRLPFDMLDSGADAVLLSGHKLGGPQGTGAAVLAPGITLRAPLVRGGGQERGFRSGTENVAGLSGFGAAAEHGFDPIEKERLTGLRQQLETGLEAFGDIVVFGQRSARLPNTTCFAAPGVSAETMLIGLDLAGFAISSGSACSSGKVSRSHVLEAMGVDPHLMGGALRVSLGWVSGAADISRFLAAYTDQRHRMQRRPVAAAA